MEVSMPKLLKSRGVRLKDIAEIVLILQKPYNPSLTLNQCYRAVVAVLKKREVQNTIMTGIALDELAEKKLLPEPLLQLIEEDEPLYGLDEVVAYGITNLYGTIGMTSFGYLDKVKTGLISRLNENKKNKVNTFLDDIIAAIAAAASARIAHGGSRNA